MSDTENPNESAESATPDGALAGGAYEVLRKRLLTINADLVERLEAVNVKRRDVFGGQESSITGNERIKTENNCVARDLVSIGNNLIFGYNVGFGLKSKVSLEDVFGLYRFEDGELHHSDDLEILNQGSFQRDFAELYRFYKTVLFLQFMEIEGKLLMVFQIGDTIRDVKVFRWALDGKGGFTYMDDRGELDFQFPPQHDFVWQKTTRDDHVSGEFPHVSIEDKVFVECVGGDLTIKIEDNISTGSGVFDDPVEYPDQTLDDAEIEYAILENLILLKVKPYREGWRYLIYNRRSQTAIRMDAIGASCVQLPEGHGIVFPRGFYLQNGETKLFPKEVGDMVFYETVRSPNGEDILYVFYHRETGRYVLIQYNLIAKSIANPIYCHGYALYHDGSMILFNDPDEEPKRVHPMQLWTTAFYDETHEKVSDTTSYLYKIGNRDLVRGISDCYAVSRLLSAEEMSLLIYQDIISESGEILDHYLWLQHDEVGNLKEVLLRVKEAALAAVQEYEKVVRIRENTISRINENRNAVTKSAKTWRLYRPTEIAGFVELLHELRSRRGHVISLKDLPYADDEQIDAIETDLETTTAEVTQACVEFLLDPQALVPYETAVTEIDAALETVVKIAELNPVEEKLDDLGRQLDLLTDVINQLEIEDATETTRIIDSITSTYASANRVKAIARNIRRDLGRNELSAEFAAQFQLLSQSITNYIGLCDTPEKCEELLTRVMVSIEELEGKFADFEDFVEQLTEKREEAYNAFSGRRQVLEEEKKRRVTTLASSAERVLKGIAGRAETLKSVDDVNGYFAADLMVVKLKETILKLRDLGDSVKADDLEGRLKSAKSEVLRSLRDKLELFADGDNLISFGEFQFTVNTQPLELTTIYREEEMFFHLTGTDYFEHITDETFLATRDLWHQELISENKEVYRAEYLAYLILQMALAEEHDLSLAKIIALSEEKELKELDALVRNLASERYAEGYEKGIHDHDASRILAKIAPLYRDAGLLRTDTTARVDAMVFWAWYQDPAKRAEWRGRGKSVGAMNRAFNRHVRSPQMIDAVKEAMTTFAESFNRKIASPDAAAEFLCDVLQAEKEVTFPPHPSALELLEGFNKTLKDGGVAPAFAADLEALAEFASSRLSLAEEWLQSWLDSQDAENKARLEDFRAEAALHLVADNRLKFVKSAESAGDAHAEGLMGQHGRIAEGRLHVRLDEFLARLRSFADVTVPRFESCRVMRAELADKRREELRLSEFQPRVMSSFVRNKLINDVYLPLIGANFAKQMGAAGVNKRTDLMGLLLLISPPGYGKTTLMEYVSARLGLTFMKINGPAIGHHVGSLDPTEAPNATAREEVEKLNLAFEMGNNVMIYLDDIQHLNPEFLQKFISLCDGQRKIEGVFQGKSRTYDLRGKKVCVVMAGNPYTESGDKFRIPDMLANRADTYNLGDISSSARDVFALSFVENSMTSNPVLARVANHGHDDVYQFLKIHRQGNQEGVEFSYPYSAAEVDETVSVLAKLEAIQKVVLRVNEQYIASAAQQDEYRTEPSFKMQGSYRNMCRMAEKVFPVMTDNEVQQVIVDHYYNEAQTLTTGAEANLLKFRHMFELESSEDTERWDEICREFNRRQLMGSADENDQMGQIMAQLSGFNSGIGDLKAAVAKGLTGLADAQSKSPDDAKPIDLTPIIEQLAAIAASSEAAKSAQPGKLEVQTQFPVEYAKAWDRQAEILEVFLPILNSFKDQSEAVLRLKEAIDRLIAGRLRIELAEKAPAPGKKKADG